MGEEKKRKIFYSSQVPTKSVAIKPRHAKIIFFFVLGWGGARDQPSKVHKFQQAVRQSNQDASSITW